MVSLKDNHNTDYQFHEADWTSARQASALPIELQPLLIGMSNPIWSACMHLCG